MQHVKGRKFTEKNKVEEIQLANLARASQAMMKTIENGKTRGNLLFACQDNLNNL